MARVRIDLPDSYAFETKIPVRITDLNYGGHVGNDVFLSLLHEIRVQFLKSYGFSEMDIDGVATIMNDAAISYKAEVFYGSTIRARVAVTELSTMSCELLYLLSDSESGKEIARAKTGMVFFDYDKRQIANMPESFRQLFSK